MSALKHEVDENVWYEFLLLRSAYRMFCCPKKRTNYLENFPIVFGENSVSYNEHNLLHLKETVEFDIWFWKQLTKT